MLFEKFQDNPFQIQISFHKLIESLEDIAKSNVDYRANYAVALLNQVQAVPELTQGITDASVIDNNKELIRHLL